MPKTHRNSLEPGYKLHWYEVQEILGQGGFGITYLAVDKNLNKQVAIKEYLPIEMAVREGNFSVHPVTENHNEQYQWGLDRFLKEARTLAQFDHPNIVRVHAVFEENNTGYMVMAYEHGDSLAEMLKGRQTMEESDLLRFLFPILGGLEQMHAAGFIHRDIKPDNIFIRMDGSPVLLDFGSARQAVGGQTRTLTSLVTPGYAPFEQYYAKSDEQGPWTDIYGLGATLYRAMAGVAPMDAVDRSNALLKRLNDTYISIGEIGKGRYSDRFLSAVDSALKFNIEDRPQSIADWREQFGLPDAPLPGTDTASIPTQPGTRFDRMPDFSTQPVTSKKTSKTAKTGTWIWLMLVLVVAIAATGFYFKPQIQHQWANWQAQQQVERLLLGAGTDLEARRYFEPPGNNAVEKYNQVLQFEPDNLQARQQLEMIAEKFARQIQENIDAADLAAADLMLDKMQTWLPEFEATERAARLIKSTRDEIALEQEAAAERQSQLDALIKSATDKAATGNATETLLMVVRAQSMGASEADIQNIKKVLWQAINIQLNKEQIILALSENEQYKLQAQQKIERLERQLENLPTPELNAADELFRIKQLAMFSAEQGFYDKTRELVEWGDAAGMDNSDKAEIKQVLIEKLSEEADQASARAKRAVQDKDIKQARVELKKAKKIKARIDKILK